MLKVGCSDVESYAFYKQYIRSKKNNVKFNQLSKEEQEELIKRTQSGDEESREQLILSNLNLVIYIVELYYSAQDEKTKEDIFQLGMEGLIIGINNIIKYDSKKFSLSTWLSYYIRRTILTQINKLNYDTTVCPDTLRRVKAYQKLLETRESNGEEVTDEEAMKCLNISSERLKTIKQFLNRSVIILGQIIDFNEDKSIILPSENRFEEERINTLEISGEIMLTVLSAMAQQESENISSHVKLGLQMKQKRGELIGYNGCLGYVYDKDTKEISINYEEAEIVRYIFERYCQGVGCTTIAKELTNMKYKTPTGKKKCSVFNFYR